MIRDERRRGGGEGGFISAYQPAIAALTLLVFIGLSVAAELTARAQSQTFNAPQGRVENVSFEQIAGGVINIYYDLISSSPDGVFSITVKASSDGGNTFSLQPSAITGDVTDVKPGARKKIVWRSGQDVAVLAFDQLKFDVVATAGTAPPSPQPAPPAGGGSKMKFIIPIAAGGAAAAFFLLKGDDAPTACSFSVSPTSVEFAAAGGSKTVDVSVTPAGCEGSSWTASAGSGFVTLSPGSGTGNGQVTLTATATASARSGNVTIAGVNVAVSQLGQTGCLTTATIPTVPYEGGTRGPITVTAAPCTPNTWSVTSTGGFISGITPATSSGNGSFTFQAAVNASATSRTGTITVSVPSSGTPISSQTLNVTQNGNPCTYSVTRTPAGALGNAAQNITVTVTNAQNCAWKASFSSNPGTFMKFLNMTADGGVTATGTGTVPLMVSLLALATGTRSGTIVITETVTNAQAGSITITQP